MFYRMQKAGIALVLTAVLIVLTAAPSVQAAGSTFQKAYANTSVRLLQQAAKKSKKKNVLISPDSVITVLSVLENGASGKTRKELKKALGGLSVSKYTSSLKKLHRRVGSSSLIRYNAANSLWYKEGEISLKQDFVQKMADAYDMEVHGAPFDSSTLKKINQWASDKTEGKIPSILNRLDPEMRAVVLNAIYFKGTWADPYVTVKKRKFTTASGKKKKVSMLEGTESTYLTVNGAKGFVKPYMGCDVALMVLLPPKGTSVNKYIKKLSGEDLVKGYKNRRTENIRVLTRLPEFSYDYSISLGTPLQKMGIRRAFTPKASFSKMCGNAIYIDDVLHKTYIDLNRYGTEAAAVTAAIAKASAVRPQTEITVKKVYCNRPFVYGIIDTKTGLPLFLGAVCEP
ncbi:MAG: serpin family protein [Lachnospiraceae bacterium]|nr:serpin family protein [Lachnospiraceae bacterium]